MTKRAKRPPRIRIVSVDGNGVVHKHTLQLPDQWHFIQPVEFEVFGRTLSCAEVRVDIRWMDEEEP